MKKIKAFANNAFVRPDRTEVLTENLQEAEKRIDQIKATCDSLAKKVQECLQGSKAKDNVVIEKRIRKVPEYLLGNAMIANCKSLGDGSILGEVLGESGQIEIKLGQASVEYEVRIEEKILKPLQILIENDLPNIYKLKRQLAKCTENMDLAKAKFTQANRHSINVGQGQGTKIENIKEEYEESLTKVEQCRDNLAAEMYSLIAREAEIAKIVVDFLTFQKHYHFEVYSILNELISNVDVSLTSSVHKPAYGQSLEDHLSSSQRSIAYPMELCVCGLLELGLEEEGLFRIAGSTSKVKKLKSAFDAGFMDLPNLLREFCDPHVMANALKCYLRELPEPLLTFELHSDWVTAIRISDNTQKLDALLRVVKKLPHSNHENLRYLVKFLKELSNHESSNKMSPANIAIVIGPNLLWPKPSQGADLSGDNTEMGFNMAMTHQCSAVLDQLVSNCSHFFPEDIDFYVTCVKPEPLEKEVERRPLVNGSSLAEEIDDLMKRSQSSSSMDNEDLQSPTQGSPKPIHIRRKNKPAPTPPTQPQPPSSQPKSNKNPLANMKPFSGGNYNTSSGPSLASIKQTSSDSMKLKREGVWIPPSPKDTARKEVSSTAPAKPPPPGISAADMAKQKFMEGQGGGGPPPKPASPLKYKSSFKSDSSNEGNGHEPVSCSTTDNINTGQVSQTAANFASLPRHFHTENSYKNRPARPPSMFGVAPPAPPSKSSTSEDPKESSESKKQVVGVETQVRKQSSSSEDEPVVDIVREEPSQQTPVVRPVPAPRSSLGQSLSFKETTSGGDTATPNVRERPSIMAKPRDLSRRNVSSHNNQQSSSPPQSTAPQEMGGADNHPIITPSQSESVVVDSQENQSQSDGMSSNNNNSASSPTKGPHNPHRPPRPHPPAPPKLGESTDL